MMLIICQINGVHYVYVHLVPCSKVCINLLMVHVKDGGGYFNGDRFRSRPLYLVLVL